MFSFIKHTKSLLCEPQTSRIILWSSYTIPMNKLCISVLNRISNDHVTTFQIIYMYALILSDNIFIIIICTTAEEHGNKLQRNATL